MKDQVRAAERRDGREPHEPMRIRYDADEHRQFGTPDNRIVNSD
jgi:hypothetical protein